LHTTKYVIALIFTSFYIEPNHCRVDENNGEKIEHDYNTSLNERINPFQKNSQEQKNILRRHLEELGNSFIIVVG
jgi:hypothetical protein